MYSIGQYYDQDTNRTRWAVFCGVTNTWYLPPKYGKRAAIKMSKQFNKG